MVRYFYCLRIARVGSTWQCLRWRHEPKLPFISKLIIHVHHQQQKKPNHQWISSWLRQKNSSTRCIRSKPSRQQWDRWNMLCSSVFCAFFYTNRIGVKIATARDSSACAFNHLCAFNNALHKSNLQSTETPSSNTKRLKIGSRSGIANLREFKKLRKSFLGNLEMLLNLTRHSWVEFPFELLSCSQLRVDGAHQPAPSTVKQ